MSDYIECPQCGATTLMSLSKLYGQSWHHCHGSVSASAVRRIVAEELREALKGLAPPSASPPAPAFEIGKPLLQPVYLGPHPQSGQPVLLAYNPVRDQMEPVELLAP